MLPPPFDAPPQFAPPGSQGQGYGAPPPYGGAPAYGPPPGYGGGSAAVDEAKKDARKALIASIVGIFCFGFILGFLAIKWGKDAKASLEAAGSNEGQGMATVAMVLGGIDIALWAIVIVMRITQH